MGPVSDRWRWALLGMAVYGLLLAAVFIATAL